MGAAAATSKLLDLDAERTTHALAIALAQPNFALQPGFMEPTSKLLAASTPTATGIQAAYFARAGMTGHPGILEDRRGFWRRFSYLPLPFMWTCCPRGWVRADPRWIEPLLALRADDDPNVSWRAAKALGNADLDMVLSKLPKPRKAVPRLDFKLLGAVPVPPSMFRRDPVWFGAGRIVVADTARTIAAHEISPGLPRVVGFALPDGVALPSRRAQAIDNAWEVPGLYDVAVRADGGIAIGAQTSNHEHVLALYDPSGARVALVRLAEGGPAFPHALHFGAGGGGALWVALDDENADVAGACDPTSLKRLGVVAFGATFPEPAWFEVVPHPREDVGVFAVQCGQDGAWLKVVERGAKLAVRKQKLNAKQVTVEIVGFSPDGATAAFASGHTISFRPWPALDAPKKKRLDGTVVGAGIVEGAVAVAVAEVSRAPSAIELRRFPDGERVAKGRYPVGEGFVALSAGVLVTRKDVETVNVWRLRPPA